MAQMAYYSYRNQMANPRDFGSNSNLAYQNGQVGRIEERLIGVEARPGNLLTPTYGYEFVPDDGIGLQGGNDIWKYFKPIDYNTSTNQKRAIHLVFAMRHALRHNSTELPINKIFNDIDQNSGMMNQGILIEEATMKLDGMLLTFKFDIAIYKSYKTGSITNAIIDFGGGEWKERKTGYPVNYQQTWQVKQNGFIMISIKGGSQNLQYFKEWLAK